MAADTFSVENATNELLREKLLDFLNNRFSVKKMSTFFNPSGWSLTHMLPFAPFGLRVLDYYTNGEYGAFRATYTEPGSSKILVREIFRVVDGRRVVSLADERANNVTYAHLGFFQILPKMDLPFEYLLVLERAERAEKNCRIWDFIIMDENFPEVQLGVVNFKDSAMKNSRFKIHFPANPDFLYDFAKTFED